MRGRHRRILRNNRRGLDGPTIACPNEISEEQSERNQQSGARNEQRSEPGSGATVFRSARSNLFCSMLRNFVDGGVAETRCPSTNCWWNSSNLGLQNDDFGYCIA